MKRRMLLQTILLCTLVLLLCIRVKAGKEVDRRDQDPGIEMQDTESAGSNPMSMSPGSGHGYYGSGGTTGLSGLKLDKYGEQYPSASSSSSSSSSMYNPSSSQHQSSAMNYYGAYGYPDSQSMVNSYQKSLGSGNGNGNGNSHSDSHSGSSNNYYKNHYSAEPYYEKTRDLNTRPSNHASVAHYGTGHYRYEASGPESMEMAASSHVGGHRGGVGWHGGHAFSKVDTSAIGLLGLLGLLSLLSNVLKYIASTTTTTAAGRRKREVVGDDGVSDDPTTEENGHERAHRITLMVLPALNVIAHARNGRVPLDCTHREVCVANQMLVEELGVQGRSVGSMISSAVMKMLKEADDSGSIGKHITKASLAGRNGQDCKVVYPVCKALEQDGAYSLPLLTQPHHLASLNLGNSHPSPVSQNNEGQNEKPKGRKSKHFFKRNKNTKHLKH